MRSVLKTELSLRMNECARVSQGSAQKLCACCVAVILLSLTLSKRAAGSRLGEVAAVFEAGGLRTIRSALEADEMQFLGEKFCSVDRFTLQDSTVFGGQQASSNHAFAAHKWNNHKKKLRRGVNRFVSPK